jgi:hypothetical protein
MNRLQSSRLWQLLNMIMKVFSMLCTHSGEDVHCASRRTGLADSVMRNRSLRNGVVRR